MDLPATRAGLRTFALRHNGVISRPRGHNAACDGDPGLYGKRTRCEPQQRVVCHVDRGDYTFRVVEKGPCEGLLEFSGIVRHVGAAVVIRIPDPHTERVLRNDAHLERGRRGGDPSGV